MKSYLRALLIAAVGVLLVADQSRGQRPEEGKKEDGKGEFRLVPPLTLKAEGRVWSVAFSPDGRWVAAATADSTVLLWDASTGQALWRHRFEINNGSVHQVTFSPDGRTLACGVAFATARLLDVATGKELAVLKHPDVGPVWSVAFSPDGRRLAAGGSGLVVWDLRTRTKLLALLGPEEFVWQVAFSPDGKTIAASSGDTQSDADSTVRFWDTETGKEVGRFQDRSDGRIESLKFSPDGRSLACGSTKVNIDLVRGVKRSVQVTRIRDVATGRTTVKLDEPGHHGLAFSPDGHLLLVSGSFSPCRLWETATGKEVHKVAPTYNTVECVAFSPDGRAVALGTTGKTVLIHTLAPDLPREGSAALGADVLERLWSGLGSDDPGKRYQAIWTLAAKPAEAIPFLKGQIERALPDLDRAVGEGRSAPWS